ncbi:MAG: valine--tRNA ligase [Alphaproteobacteria bacterium]
MLDKTFDSAAAEAKYREAWESSGAFAADPASTQEPYAIMMPPPNVTGTLHMGHGLTFTLQDVLVRYYRMRQRDTLHQPGTDHAGIAVQAIIDRKLDAEGLTKQDIGREEFLRRAWEWKEESGNTITRQLRYLGATPDWDRERFTMDEGLSQAVKTTFVQLYREGLIYKDKRLVNWDTKLKTAVSDLEVEQKEIDGNLWHFKYPIDGEEGRFITVATTRPETMLGDTGVAVNPDDDRYKDLVGKHVKLPLVGRLIPIVADDYADPETGSGAVKITPAHDFNDFEVGKRNDLEMINILNADGTLNEEVPAAYQGMDRFDARKKVVADLEVLGCLDKIDNHVHMVPHGDRSGTVIEPWLTDQWYANAQKLAEPAIAAVEDGRTKFVPENFADNYFHWMRNIQPWCISRQLWWGHQIPAWYGPDGTVFVAESIEEAQAEADAHYGNAVALSQDEDVLDTWFSSALWPFSTLGWPEKTPELDKYYPGNVLVTGWDIIFFWVARMMMMGLHFMGDVPFRTVYIHTLVRDQYGQKMSKSKGNVIDPLDLIEKYGADALRFTMTALAAPGRDIKLAESRVEGYRNFTTKLWNAVRFAEMNEAKIADGFDPAKVTHVLNTWIVSRVNETVAAMDTALETYRYDGAASALYQFIWHEFCDWYIELSKPMLYDTENTDMLTETRSTMAWALDRLVHLAHPIMPFVSEALFEQFVADAVHKSGQRLITAPWPETIDLPASTGAAAAEVDWLIGAISAIRTARAELNIPAGAKVAVQVSGGNETTLARVASNRDQLLKLARLESIEVLTGDMPKGAAQVVVEEATFVIPLEGLLDISAEIDRLTKEMGKHDATIGKLNGMLSNENFVARAPEEVIAKNKALLADAEQAKAGVEAALDRLKALG